jgi:hypothetical protein
VKHYQEVTDPQPRTRKRHTHSTCDWCGRPDDVVDQDGFGPTMEINISFHEGEEGGATWTRDICFMCHLSILGPALISAGFVGGLLPTEDQREDYLNAQYIARPLTIKSGAGPIPFPRIISDAMQDEVDHPEDYA